MNAKVFQFLGLGRYHQHGGQYHRHHQQLNLNRFSLKSWKSLVEKLSQELPVFHSRSKKGDYFKALQNGFRMVVSFLGKECSPIVAQRAFRGYRMFQLHSKLWSFNSSNPVSKKALLSLMMLSLCQGKNTVKQTIEEFELKKYILCNLHTIAV